MLLYFGREIIIPIALAILLSFVLAPLVGLLQRVRVPRGLAVVSVVILRIDICDGAVYSSTRHPTGATGRGFAAISIHDKREDPIISRNDSRSRHTRTGVWNVEGRQQRIGQTQGRRVGFRDGTRE